MTHDKKLALVTLILRGADRKGWQPSDLEYRALETLYNVIAEERRQAHALPELQNR